MNSIVAAAACAPLTLRMPPQRNPALFLPQLKSSYMQFMLRRFRSRHSVVVPERCMLKIRQVAGMVAGRLVGRLSRRRWLRTHIACLGLG